MITVRGPKKSNQKSNWSKHLSKSPNSANGNDLAVALGLLVLGALCVALCGTSSPFRRREIYQIELLHKAIEKLEQEEKMEQLFNTICEEMLRFWRLKSNIILGLILGKDNSGEKRRRFPTILNVPGNADSPITSLKFLQLNPQFPKNEKQKYLRHNPGDPPRPFASFGCIG